MTSIFNFFKSGAYLKSNTGASASDSGSSSNTTPVVTETNDPVSSSNDGDVTMVDKKEIESKSTSSEIVERQNIILSIQPEERPVFNGKDLEELIKMKEHLQYKPSVMNLIAVYQAEITKHVDYGIKKSTKKVQNYQIEPAPTNSRYVFLTSSGLPGVYCTNNDIIDYSHFQALKQGRSVTHSFDSQNLPNIEEVLKNQTKISSNSSIESKKKELEILEKNYTELIKQKEKLLVDRAAVLSPEELAIIEEEEGWAKRTEEESDQWEIERKKRIIENERKLIEKRLVDSKKHKNVRFYCKGELEYLTKWNDHFIKTNSENAPKGLEPLLRYSLKPTNVFDLDAEEIHYRFCESQLHRLSATPAYGSSYPGARVVKVDYIVNPVILKRFNACKQALAEKHGFLLESMKPLLLFHGTSDANMENILKTNFLLNKIGSTTDMGFYGKGFYFSEYASMSMAYARNQYLLICMVLIGKAFHMNTVETGRPIEPGYDSHVSPDGCSEVIIFNPDQIIPLYKIEWVQN